MLKVILFALSTGYSLWIGVIFRTPKNLTKGIAAIYGFWLGVLICALDFCLMEEA